MEAQEQLTRVLFRRESGKRLTYEIAADESGTYSISLNGKELKRRQDQLVLRRLRAPGPDVLRSAVSYAKADISYLLGMKEE